MSFHRGRNLVALVGLLCGGLAGCTIGPQALQNSHQRYNQAIKQTLQEELLLNFVRLRYSDMAVRLDVSSVAAQFEVTGELQMQPFLAAAAPPLGVFSRLLPFASIMGADRPTITLDSRNDAESLRHLFTPIELDMILELCSKTWPVDTVFRLWFESVNHVANATTPCGSAQESEIARFRRGVELLRALLDQEAVELVIEDKIVEAGSPLPADQVNGGNLVEAAKNGLEYRKSDDGKSWMLVRHTRQARLRIHPAAYGCPELLEFCDIFHLQPGLPTYDLVMEGSSPAQASPGSALAVVVRSPVQVLFFLSQGVAMPTEQSGCGGDAVAADGCKLTDHLFAIHCAKGWCAPAEASVAVKYRDTWYFIDDHDATTKATFLLMTYLNRLYTAKTPDPKQNLSLLIGGR